MKRIFKLVQKRLYKKHNKIGWKNQWDAKWADPNFNPRWKSHGIPLVLQELVESHNFHPGASALDIGCGAGEVASWLVDQGFQVTGIDFSESAIKRANSAYQHKDLRFMVRDMCEYEPAFHTYDLLFDRGCFHVLDGDCINKYGDNVSRYIKPSGKFLLLHTCRHKKSPLGAKQVKQKVYNTFTSAFSIDSMRKVKEETGVPFERNDKPERYQLAFLMTRK